MGIGFFLSLVRKDSTIQNNQSVLMASFSINGSTIGMGKDDMSLEKAIAP
jgi:hypothetical protein